MEIGIIQEPSICMLAYQFYRTIEGSLIGHLRRHGKATLHELLEHVVNNSSLRTKHSKKYRNKNIEKLALSKLLTKKHIFIEGQSGIWTLNENNAMEYKQQKIVEIKKIKERSEKKYELKAKQYEKDKIKCHGLKSA